MTKKVDTWMPLLVDKYLGDTMLLTTEQHGAYLLLLMSMWKKDGRLPDNDQQLAQAARLSLSRWKATRPVLIDGALLRAEDGFIVQKRLSAELSRAKAHTEAKAEAGLKGAAKRWQKGEGSDKPNDGKADGSANGTAMADPSLSQSQTGAPIPTPEASLLPSSDEEGGEKPAASHPPGPQVDLLGDVPDCPHEAIIAAFHEALPMARRVRDWTPTRAQMLRQRWREDRKRQSLAWWQKFFAYCAESQFLTGRTNSAGRKPFELGLEWLVKAENFAKVREGAYHEARTEQAEAA